MCVFVFRYELLQLMVNSSKQSMRLERMRSRTIKKIHDKYSFSRGVILRAFQRMSSVQFDVILEYLFLTSKRNANDLPPLKVKIPVAYGANRKEYDKIQKQKRRVVLKLLQTYRRSKGLTERMINVAQIRTKNLTDYKLLERYILSNFNNLQYAYCDSSLSHQHPARKVVQFSTTQEQVVLDEQTEIVGLTQAKQVINAFNRKQTRSAQPSGNSSAINKESVMISSSAINSSPRKPTTKTKTNDTTIRRSDGAELPHLIKVASLSTATPSTTKKEQKEPMNILLHATSRIVSTGLSLTMRAATTITSFLSVNKSVHAPSAINNVEATKLKGPQPSTNKKYTSKFG
jgi:hypothetical protein